MKRRRVGKIVLVLEGLLILTWVYLLFQYHPGAEAIDPATVVPQFESCRALRLGIEAQLATHHRNGNQMAAAVESAGPEFGEVFVPEASETVETAETAAPSSAIVEISVQPGRQSVPNSTSQTDNQANPLTSFDQPRADQPASRQPSSDPVPYCPYRVSTIIIGGTRPLAVLVDNLTGSSYFVSPGETVGCWTMTAISESTVTLATGSVKKSLRLE